MALPPTTPDRRAAVPPLILGSVAAVFAGIALLSLGMALAYGTAADPGPKPVVEKAPFPPGGALRKAIAAQMPDVPVVLGDPGEAPAPMAPNATID